MIKGIESKSSNNFKRDRYLFKKKKSKENYYESVIGILKFMVSYMKSERN